MYQAASDPVGDAKTHVCNQPIRTLSLRDVTHTSASHWLDEASSGRGKEGKNERAEWLAPRWRHAVALHTHALPLINRWRHRGSDNDLARFRLWLAQSVNHDTRNRRPNTTLPGRMLKQRLQGFPPPRAGFTARPWTRIGQLALFFTRLVFVILTQDTREHAKQTNNKAPRINKPRYIAPRPTLLMHESWSFSIRSISIINKPSKEFTPRSTLRIN